VSVSTLILYNAGAYGTYLEWVLTTLVSTNEIKEPFTSTGSSHNFLGNLLESVDELPLLKTPIEFARIHPKTSQSHRLHERVAKALDSSHRVIFLYPDQQSILLNLNNFYTKICKDWFAKRLNEDPVFSENLYNNWNIPHGTPSAQISDWIKREILSYNFMPSWFDEVEWFFPNKYSHPRCKFIMISDLLYDFEKTLVDLQRFCNLNFKKTIAEMVPYHCRMMSLQKFLNQDQLCDDIVNSICDNTYFEWRDLPMASQCWVQWKLRQLGFEIRCYELDIFPTNSIQLQELIYKA
jgi:hypothetical protein